MPRLAIVVSAVGNTQSLESTLVSVLENRPADCQIVVALREPYADPYDLKDEVRFVRAASRATSTAAIHQALAVTRAPFVHLLSSGCSVTEGWADEALARFGDRQVASVAPLVMDARDNERIFAAGVGYHRGGTRYLVGHGLTELSLEASTAIVGACGFAGFYRKAALDFVGGLSSRLGGRQADVDLALVLARAGFTTVLAPSSRILAVGEADPPLGPFQQALNDERLFWRNLAAGNRAGALAAHAGTVAMELVKSLGRPRMITQLAARTLGCAQFGSYLRHQRLLGELARRAVRPVAHGHTRVDASHRIAGPSEPAGLHAR